MTTPGFFWHDYETFGLNPQRDFPAQFAGVRTDYDFNILGQPLVLYCKPGEDYLPEPDACVITGITPQLAAEKGVCEAEFIGQINQVLSQPQTCSLGYNSLRFDDEVTRNALYRNFYDPYQREWQNGNSRWDLIDVVRAVHALRPEGINWVTDEEGKTSFKLTDLTAANQLSHEAAHDALSDVYATIAVARLVKQKQPKLYEFLFTSRLKTQVQQLLQLGSFKPVLHVSGKYPARKNCIAAVLPLCVHPTNPNGVLVYDLSVDPQPLLELTVEEIKQRIFTATADLPEGVERIPLKTIHINRCPVLAQFSILRKERQTQQRLNIEPEVCLAHLEKIKVAQKEVNAKINLIFSGDNFTVQLDPDLMIYSGGFFNSSDKAQMTKIRNTPPDKLSALTPHFEDRRLAEMFFRYKGRNYPQSLSAQEQMRWRDFCLQRLNAKKQPYLQRLNELKQQGIDSTLIQALEAYLDIAFARFN
jgi:exodeoxyribonuclease I